MPRGNKTALGPSYDMLPQRTSSARNSYANAKVTHNQLGTMEPHKLSCRLPPAAGAIAHAMPTSTQTHAGVASPPPPPLPLPPLLLLLSPLLAISASEEITRHST